MVAPGGGRAGDSPAGSSEREQHSRRESAKALFSVSRNLRDGRSLLTLSGRRHLEQAERRADVVLDDGDRAHALDLHPLDQHLAALLRRAVASDQSVSSIPEGNLRRLCIL